MYCILDYGSGNVRSVYNMLSLLSEDVVVSNAEQDIRSASHLILPGVGAFGAAMGLIRATLPVEVIEEQVFGAEKPFLGVCVGMQVLADWGDEFGGAAGFGWIPGRVSRLDAGDNQLPHIGWNSIESVGTSKLFAGLPGSLDVYFLHSYAFQPEDPGDIAATCEYGSQFVCAVARGNIFGVQFHPEKSQAAGFLVLANFLGLPTPKSADIRRKIQRR